MPRALTRFLQGSAVGSFAGALVGLTSDRSAEGLILHGRAHGLTLMQCVLGYGLAVGLGYALGVSYTIDKRRKEVGSGDESERAPTLRKKL